MRQSVLAIASLMGAGVTAAAAAVTIVSAANASEPKPVAQPASTVLAQVLPFYGKDAPDWCLEDMACWIGSNADGRTDEQIVAQMADNIEEASRAYGDDTFPEWEDVNTALLPDGSALVDVLGEGERQDYTGCLVHFDDTTVIVCPDGYVETS